MVDKKKEVKVDKKAVVAGSVKVAPTSQTIGMIHTLKTTMAKGLEYLKDK
ncbi:MAG: hypothetical protein FWD15_05045 [Alphaproteobacteria bacterium]|nr:hypothetical protein [Alphaproteobacteria bacterium]